MAAVQQTVYHNGAMVPAQLPEITSGNRAFHYGDGVFETMRVYGGRVFRIGDHVRRLFAGLGVLRIPPGFVPAAVEGAVTAVLQANRLDDAVVKVVAYRTGPEGPEPPAGAEAGLFVAAKPFDAGRQRSCMQGISGRVVSIRRNCSSPLVSIKSLNYLENILGRLEARDHDADEALFLNGGGSLAEGATSNIFIVSRGKVMTPSEDAGILRGITREVVIGIAQNRELACSREAIGVPALKSADEAFLTNSVMEIMPLVRVDGEALSNGQVGPVTRMLMKAYRDLVCRELYGDQDEDYSRQLL